MTTTPGANGKFDPEMVFVRGLLADPQSAVSLAHALGLEVATPGDDAALAAALEGGKDCVVVWSDPSPTLAAALAEGGSPQAVLADWQAQAQGLLDLQRRHRRQLVLLSEAALSSDDPKTLAQLRDRLGLDAAVAPAAPAADGLAALTGLLAALTVRELDMLRPVLAELEAASLYCPRPTLSPERLENAARWLAHDRTRLALMADQIRLMSDALADAGKAREERDRLAGDLAQMHEKLIARENDLAGLRAWRNEVYASNSWKVTAPLRRVSRMLGRYR